MAYTALMSTGSQPPPAVSSGCGALDPRGRIDSCSATARAANLAFYWTLTIALHGYWYLGGRVGTAISPTRCPALLDSRRLDLQLRRGRHARRRPRRPQRPCTALGTTPAAPAALWSMDGCAVLVARGGSGLLDDGLRFTGLADGGLPGSPTRTCPVAPTHPRTRSCRPRHRLDLPRRRALSATPRD